MRLSPGSFNQRNSEMWWNYLRSAVYSIDTSDERHSHSVLFGRSLTLQLAGASLKEDLAGEPTDPSFRRERSHRRTPFSRSSPKGHQAEEISPPRSSGL